MILPFQSTSLLLAWLPLFTQPTTQRVLLLLNASLLTTGRQTIANLLRTLGPLVRGHRTSYQRVLSAASWSSLQLAAALARFLIQHWLPEGPIVLVGDDTVERHPGRHVYGKARHRDAVRSSRTHTVWSYGHRWVVLAVLVRFPWASRPWALPVLVDLYRSAELDRARRRPHRTPPQLMKRLLRQMLWWFPQRTFVFVGDGGYGTHELARFCRRHQPRLTLVSKLHAKANLFTPPPTQRRVGRPRVKGAALPKPAQAVAQARRLHWQRVGWYGGQTRQVAWLSQTGHWYKAGQGLVPIRWVFVRDREGTHRDEYFFSTDWQLDPATIITLYTGRWNIETTSQEARSELGLSTTRGWCRRTVLRAAPCLLGLYTVVALLYAELPASQRGGVITWPGKAGVTFGDALRSVRRAGWTEILFSQGLSSPPVEKLPAGWRDFLLDSLAAA